MCSFIVPPTIPSPPHSLMPHTIYSNMTYVTWLPPLNNGSLAILQYILRITSVPHTCTNISSIALSVPVISSVDGFTVGPLKPAVVYRVVIVAVNSKGNSNDSEIIEFQTKESSKFEHQTIL